MPRPLLKSSELRAKVDCYFSQSERTQLSTKAKLSGLALSTYIREAALGNPINVLPTINAERWGELARTTANLNQLVHHINDGSAHGVDVELIFKLLKEIQALRSELIGASR